MQKTVIILGMHRSGTSMVAGILNCLGIDMGEDQPGKQVSNPLGHFEDVDFLSINKNILASAGGNWFEPPAYSDILALRDDYLTEIQILIQDRSNKSPKTPWGWKDPRTSLTIDLYLPFLDQPYYIWCRRDPSAICKSLQKRNQIQLSHCQDLIEYYNNQIKDFTLRNPGIPVLIVDYEDVIKEPEFWIRNLNQYLGLDPDIEQINRAIAIVLDPNKLLKEKWLVRIYHQITTPIRLFKRLFGQ